MRHVELSELTKLVENEEEISSIRDSQYTFAMFASDLESWFRIDKWTRQVRYVTSHHIRMLILLTAMVSYT